MLSRITCGSFTLLYTALIQWTNEYTLCSAISLAQPISLVACAKLVRFFFCVNGHHLAGLHVQHIGSTLNCWSSVIVMTAPALL